MKGRLVSELFDLGRDRHLGQVFVRQHLFAAAAGSQVHQRHVPGDGVDPRSNRSRWCVCLSGAVDLEEGLLEQILGHGGISDKGPEIAEEGLFESGIQTLEVIHAAFLVAGHQRDQPFFLGLPVDSHGCFCPPLCDRYLWRICAGGIIAG